MATRNGKIANLPNDIREQLNLRLLEGETGRELAAWLNALPEVQPVLGSHFNGSPISEVNLTHWRQGGYLQWLTERECFDSARALADGDCNLEKTGLTAERLLNILTLRYGELLMRWDVSPCDDISETAAFSIVAKKARILQGISRSVLAIHRVQSQSASSKADHASSSADSPARSSAPSATALKSLLPSDPPTGVDSCSERQSNSAPVAPALSASNPIHLSVNRAPGLADAILRRTRAPRSGGAPREILSGPIPPSSVALDLSHTPFKVDRTNIDAISEELKRA
jgi:hypothetical protein